LYETNDLDRVLQAVQSMFAPCHTLLLLCWLSGSEQSSGVVVAGQVQGFPGLPTSYWLILSDRNPRSSCVSIFSNSFSRSLWAFAA